MNHDSTSFWLNELKQGNPEARDRLIAIMNTRMQAITRKMLRGFPNVGRFDNTDDVWQEASMKLYRALESPEVKPDTTQRFIGLSCLQIRRTLIDLARKCDGPHGQRRNFDSVDVDEHGIRQTPDRSDQTNDPVRLLRWAEFHERVDELPAELLEVFNLIYYSGLNTSEAAEVMGYSRQTANRRYRQALEQLAKHFPEPE